MYVGVPALLIAVAAGWYSYLLVNGDLGPAFASLDRRFAEEQGLLTPTSASTAQRAQTLWTWEALSAGALQFWTQALSMALMPFLPFLGPLDLAHDLILARFAGELVGRLLSHAQQGLDVPQPVVSGLVVVTLLGRGGLLAALLVGAYGPQLEPVRACWYCGLFYALAGWSQSEIMATFVDGAPKDEARRARLLMLLGFAAQLVALAVTVPMVESRSWGLRAFDH